MWKYEQFQENILKISGKILLFFFNLLDLAIRYKINILSNKYLVLKYTFLKNQDLSLKCFSTADSQLMNSN